MINLLIAAISFGTAILLGTLGEILTEKSGNLNLGVPGIMYLGGIAGLAAAFAYENMVAQPVGIVCIIISFLAAFLAAAFGGLIYSFLTISLRANQNVTGLTLTIFGGGLANFFGGVLNTMAGGVGQIRVAPTSNAYRANLASLFRTTTEAGQVEQPNWFIQLFLGHGFMVYLAIVLAVLVYYFLNKTRTGLNLRAVGENPATADAVGINVTRYKYLSTCIGAGVSGLGGLYYTMDYIKGTWGSDGTIEAIGWLAVALVIFASWKSLRAVWGAYLFAFLYWLSFYLPQIREWIISVWNTLFSWWFTLAPDALGWMNLSTKGQELFKILPYVATILVLVFVSLRKKRENEPPAHLGLPYFREER